MNIAFQGFNKLAVQRYNISNSKTEIISLNCELINDKFGNDLDNFIKLLPDSDNLTKNGMLNVKIWKYKENPHGPFMQNLFCINNNNYLVVKENFKLFEDIADFLKRIIHLSDKELSENRISDENYLYDNFMLNKFTISREELEQLYSPQYIKDVATDMVKTMTEDIYECIS